MWLLYGAGWIGFVDKTRKKEGVVEFFSESTTPSFMEPPIGLEPMTYSLRVSCSTS